MATLLLRLAGSLQAWGDDSKFETRRTKPYPTKSGVTGLLAAALGRSREDSVADLTSLRFGVRFDKEGKILRDYHTVSNEKDSYITNRYYLSDAVFLVGFEGDMKFLSIIEESLKNPAYPLYLGRRSCPPDMPLVLGIRDTELIETLKSEYWLLADWRQKNTSDSERQLRIIADDCNSNVMVKDLPVSFSKKRREFTWRGVTDFGYVKVSPNAETATEHDPFSIL